MPQSIVQSWILIAPSKTELVRLVLLVKHPSVWLAKAMGVIRDVGYPKGSGMFLHKTVRLETV